MYINKDTKKILTFREMQKEWREEYDGDDETNLMTWKSQYKQLTNRDLDMAETELLLARTKAKELLKSWRYLNVFLYGNTVGNPLDDFTKILDGMERDLKKLFITQQETDGKVFELK